MGPSLLLTFSIFINILSIHNGDQSSTVKLHQAPKLRRYDTKSNKLSSDFVSSMECGIRQVALNFSQQIINRYNDRVYDALQLNQCTNQTKYDIKHNPKETTRDYHETNPSLIQNFNKYLNNIKSNTKLNDVKLIEFYVDINNGNDNNSGSKQAPFQHIKTAKNNIKLLQSNNNDIIQFIVYIRAGTYYEGSFSFNNDDNGLSSQYPIIYTSYNSEQVIISGGKQISFVHFERINTSNSNTMIAKLNISNNECNMDIFDQLFINTTHRLIRARSPNGNPEIDIQPKGYGYSINGYNGQQPYPNNGIYISIVTPSRNSTIYPYFGSDNDPRGKWEAYHVGGDAKRFIDNKNFWNGTVPAGLTYNITDNLLHLNNSFISKNNTNINPFIANVFHTALWGNWIFTIDQINAEKGQIGFNFGGFQEGHGGYMSSGNYNKQNPQPFYVENDIQCLDEDGEWYFNANNKNLYLKPNKSDEIFMNNIYNVKYDNDGNFKSFDLDIQIPTNYRILNIEGDSDKLPVTNIMFNNILFTHSLRTQLLGYEVPSGGDWSIHRGGSIFLQNTENITFLSCTILRSGGNDIFLSNYNYNINITGNNFLFSGDSSIAIVGTSNLMDGFSNNRYSNNIYIDSNYMDTIGVFGKQTSALFTSIAGGVYFTNNVLHSGPRAGININDGFYGNKIINNNLIFNWVRETQDHGPINTWDRVEYIFKNGIINGNNPTNIAQWNRIIHNFIYNGPNGNKGSGNLFPTIDNDDGSRMYSIIDNVLIYGGTKNYLGDDKIWNNNLIIFPSHWPGGGQCITAWSGQYHIFENNQCIFNYVNPLGYLACNPYDWNQSSKQMPFGKNNTIFVPKSDFKFYCGNQTWSLKELQSKGWEIGSTVQDIPTDQQIVNMVNNKIFGSKV